jgi:hypothetical protein
VRDYRSTREDFNQVFSEVQGKREALIPKVLDRIPDLKRNILREEWARAWAHMGMKIAPTNKTLIETRIIKLFLLNLRY